MKEDKKHTCKYCKRSFHSGKSLGGHMRSHLSTSTSLLEKQELEDGALCLVLMSRERSHGGVLGEEEELGLRKRVRSQLGSDHTKISSFLSCKKSRVGVGSINVEKGRFCCTSCDKSFDSHQALGGHRASHNKNKSTVAVDNYDEGEVMKVKKKIITGKRFECSICLRVFPSGQALGGHKRSHLVANPMDVASDSVEDSSSVTNGLAGLSKTRVVQRDLENEVISGSRSVGRKLQRVP